MTGLEVRICKAKGCSTRFKTLAESLQAGCCNDHQKQIVGAGTPVRGAHWKEYKRNAKPTKPEPEQSSTPRKGVLSIAPSDYAILKPTPKPSESEAVESTPDLPPQSESSTTSNETCEGNEMLNSHEEDTESGTSETERQMLQKSESDEIVENPIALPTEPLKHLDEARSISMGLCHDAANQLLGLLKQFRSDCKGKAPDFRNIHAMANLGGQIASLSKVTLDAIKEARK